jgi:hypothetical protein
MRLKKHLSHTENGKCKQNDCVKNCSPLKGTELEKMTLLGEVKPKIGFKNVNYNEGRFCCKTFWFYEKEVFSFVH